MKTIPRNSVVFQKSCSKSSRSFVYYVFRTEKRQCSSSAEHLIKISWFRKSSTGSCFYFSNLCDLLTSGFLFHMNWLIRGENHAEREPDHNYPRTMFRATGEPTQELTGLLTFLVITQAGNCKKVLNEARREIHQQTKKQEDPKVWGGPQRF